MKKNNDLKPCPFCESNDLRIVDLVTTSGISIDIIPSCVECLNCGCDGPKIAFVKDVIKSWNERNE